MAIYFISDLHLSSAHPELTLLFKNFINQNISDLEELYILGDLFEYWIGEPRDTLDNNTAWYTEILEIFMQLKSAHKPVYFIHGNRDFLLDNSFFAKAKVMPLKDPYLLSRFGTNYLLTHGDLLCTDDTKYQLYRKCVQNKFTITLFRCLPYNYKIKIANYLRQSSIKSLTPLELTQPKYNANSNAITAWLKQYSANIIIHGHTHRAIQEANRIVLGCWGPNISYLKIDANNTTLIA